MRRRGFMMFLGGSAVGLSIAARAQQGHLMRRIGVLFSTRMIPPVAEREKLRAAYAYSHERAI